MHALAIAFAAIAVFFMILAIVGMVTGRPGALAGGVIRGVALLSFIAAVVLNIAAH